MQALRHAEDNNREFSGAKRRSRAAFGRSRALESTATGTMLTQFLLVRKSGKAFDEDAGAQTRRRKQSGVLRSNAHVAGDFRQEPRLGEHSYRHNAQCARKPLLRLREPESTAAAET
ncbi:unnamed protein product [Coccothraustes coccothraustes]